ncbi:MAG: hypothetical protein BroJett040_12560 [Oligoflexia bacterium]|nr:MAG: hypothetical protein BroJett040_12560 [Oligoflexia bacterium]
MNHLSKWVFVFLAIFSLQAIAADTYQSIPIEGQIFDEQTGQPLTATSVKFRVSVFTAVSSGSCLLWRETHTQNLSTTDGLFLFYLGLGSSQEKDAGISSITEVFNNSVTSINGVSGACSVASTDDRQVQIEFSTDNGVTYTSLNKQSMKAVPVALYAEKAGEALKMGGVEISTTPPTNGQALLYDATSGKWEPTTLGGGTGTVTSITAGTGLTGGTITTSGTLAVDVGTTAGKIPQLDGAGKIPAALLPSITVSVDQITSGSGKYFTYAPNGTACANGELLKWDNTALRWICGTADIPNLDTSKLTSGILPIARGGTNSGTTLIGNKIMISSGGAIVENANVMSINLPMKTDANGNPSTGAIDLSGSDVTGILGLANGGTGSTTGSITGTGALTFAAGGTNQNVTLTPSGAGHTILNGKVGVGTSSPGATFHVYDTTSTGATFESNSITSIINIKNNTGYTQIYTGSSNTFLVRTNSGKFFRFYDDTGSFETAALKVSGGTPAVGRVLASTDASGNATWQDRNLGPFNCPTGYTLVGTAGSRSAFCISDQKTAATWSGALDSCFDLGARLCSIEERVTACRKGGVALTIISQISDGITNPNHEWTSNHDGGGAISIVSYSGCSPETWELYQGTNGGSYSLITKPYRCCFH